MKKHISLFAFSLALMCFAVKASADVGIRTETPTQQPAMQVMPGGSDAILIFATNFEVVYGDLEVYLEWPPVKNELSTSCGFTSKVFHPPAHLKMNRLPYSMANRCF